MRSPNKWILGVCVPLAVAAIGGILTKDFWQGTRADGKLFLVSVSAKPLEKASEYSDYSVPVMGLRLEELRPDSLARPSADPPADADVAEYQQSYWSSVLFGSCNEREIAKTPHCERKCDRDCCKKLWAEQTAVSPHDALRLIFHPDNDKHPAAFKGPLQSNDLGIAIYKVEQVFQPEVPPWYSEKECISLAMSAVGGAIPGKAAPFIMDMTIRNDGETEAIISGFVSRPLYLGPGECGGGGIVYDPVNREALVIDVDLEQMVTRRFSSPIGIKPNDATLVRSAINISREKAECGAGFIYRLDLLYFDGRREQQLFVGNFGFDGI